LFRDAGLGIATVQREVLTHEEASTLFWINVLVGVALTIAATAMGPFLVTFYKEPRLLAVTIVSASAFLFNSVSVQHRALLSRAMCFTAMARIDILASALSALTGIGMAVSGWGYWALVGMGLTGPVVTAAAVWLAMPWLPGKPLRWSSVRSLLHVGGTVTLNNVVVYLAYNTEKILLGRFWGAEALGLYGRAFQLANLPVQQLSSSIGTVAYPALSRAQSDPERLRSSFLQGYSVVISMAIPATLSCALFAEEIVRFLLGPKWNGAAALLRLLAPAVLALALINPFGWFLQATGRAVRSLNIAFLIAPVVILGDAAGLRYGPTGVAIGYSTAMMLLVIPILAWAKHGTGMTAGEYWESIRRPLTAGAIATAAGWLFKAAWAAMLPGVWVLIVGLTLVLGVYGWTLLVAMEQRTFYVDLFSEAFQGPAVAKG
jgi:PST family polysaccharide transporter